METPLVRIDPLVMSGAPCFTGTRVPVRSLTDALAAGDNLNDFLEGFPGVQREQALAFLNAAAERVSAEMITDRESAA